MDQLVALASWNEALVSLGMELRGGHRKANRIRYKVNTNRGTIDRIRGVLWQGKEVGSEVGISIQEIADAEIDGEVPSPQSSPPSSPLILAPQRTCP